MYFNYLFAWYLHICLHIFVWYSILNILKFQRRWFSGHCLRKQNLKILKSKNVLATTFKLRECFIGQSFLVSWQFKF